MRKGISITCCKVPPALRMPKKDDATASDPDDQTVFRAAMQNVTPLPPSDKVIVKQRKPQPKPRHSNRVVGEMDKTADVFPDIAVDDEWSFLRPGVSRQTLRRLRNRYWVVQDHLDLHGLTQDAARQQLALFLEHAAQNRYQCVLIIHGKGLSSANGIPVLKYRIGGWLVQYSAVLAFCQARPEDGGSGAILVLLKK